ncbi:hypothetical protein CFC21_045365 [Triticum aestivum]|uniref:Uncharacterized protein n=2 Tax=Triticum aestivum TaxID=4565 RepID=A0A9R1FSE4_WHEAT|nr:hypothetical protein CFC21_045365 [Triticum aestivum]
MPLSNEVLPAVLAPKVTAARHQVHELIDLIAEVSAEVGFRRCAIGERNAGQIVGAGNLMAEIEGAHRVLVPTVAFVTGLFMVYESQFGDMMGTEQEVEMKNNLAQAKLAVQVLNRSLFLLGSNVLEFDLVVSNYSLLDPTAHADAESSLCKAANMCRLIQTFAGTLQFHLKVFEGIYSSGVLFPHPQ